MANLIMLIGPPGCGKSTVADSLNNLGYEVVSSDTVRKDIYGREDIQGDPKTVFEKVHSIICNFLSEGKDVVFDATNCKREHRSECLIPAGYFADTIIAAVYTGTLQECLTGNQKRERHVPDEVICTMFETLKHQMPDKSEGFDAIVDLDHVTDLIRQGFDAIADLDPVTDLIRRLDDRKEN